MYFDAPKVVRSPGCDHGHDEESRNGRDIKIDILDDYVWTSKRFRESSGIYTTKKYTSVMIRVCHSRSRFLSCMYIHDDFMTESKLSSRKSPLP